MPNPGEQDEGRRIWLTLAFAAWILVWGGSFLVFEGPPDAGLSERTAFLGWQGIAGCLAVWVFGLGRRLPKGSGARRLASGPLILAIALIAMLVLQVGWR